MKKWKYLLPLLLILSLMLTLYFSGYSKALNFDTLKDYRNDILDYVKAHPILTPFLYILTYIVVAALSIPGGLILSLLGGFLFPQPFCTLYVLIGATIGATILFLSAKTALKPLFEKRATPFLHKMEEGFNRNAASYLLFLRFIPLFPFWVVNLAPAFFNVRPSTYIWTTLIGISPGAFAFTQAGRGLNAIFASGTEFNLNTIFNTQMKIALTFLALFSLLPILIKKWREKHDRK